MADIWQRAAEDYSTTTWREMHPLLRGLFETLPTPGAHWSAQDRQRWLYAAMAIFAQLYEIDPATDSASLPYGIDPQPAEPGQRRADAQ